MTAVIEPRAEIVAVRVNRARTDAAVRFTATVLFWASLWLVTYWWIADGGLSDLAAWEPGLNSLGRLAGLIASDLLLVQVLLIARIPLLEAAFGQDQMVTLHRLVGFTSFNLMVVHIVANTWGYAGGRLLDTPATLWDLTWNYPGMLLAVAGAGCLVMVVVTSVKLARRTLRYESWHLLHLYAYLGVGLALPHQLWTGQQFVDSPGKTVFWWSSWALAACSVLVFRVGLPLIRSSRHRLRVTSVVPEGDGVTSVYMTGRKLERLRAESGQYFTWRFRNRRGWTRGNPYSLSAAPDGHNLRISIKALGDNSSRTAAIRPGTPVLIEGPYGRLSPRARTRRKLALIGAGVGIAPLRALAEELDYASGDAVLIYRFSDRALYENEFAALGRDRGLRVVMLPGSRRAPSSWMGPGADTLDDVAALRVLVPDIAERDVYVCGPRAWTDSVRRAAGVADSQFHVENFGW